MSTAEAESSARHAVRGLPDPGERVPALARPTVALYVASLALFATEAYGVLVADWSRWVTVPMGAAVTFLMFSVLHEATHHAISTDSRLNDLFGRLSVLFVAPHGTFGLIKFIHIEHHRNTNEPQSIDPDSWTEEGPRWQLPLRWITLDLYYVYFYLHRITERPRREVVAAGVSATVVVGALVALASNGYASEVLWLYVVPQRIGVFVLAWWFDYLPHHGLTATPSQDRFQATRVRVGAEPWLTPLFVYQNYHLVHHLHPSVPFYRYVRAWRRNEKAYVDRNAAISTWFGRSLTPSEYRTWRRITEDLAVAPDGGPAHRPVFHPLRVSELDRLTDDAVLVTFDVPADLAEEYAYAQGQHVTLRAVVDGTEVRRSYSIVSAVSAGRLTVAVKRVEAGVFSTYVNRDLQVGDILDVMSPTGRFRTELDPSEARTYVGVAAGSGITPLMSIITTTLEVEPESRFTLVYGNSTRAGTMFTARLAELEAQYPDRFAVHHVLSREAGPHTGRITADLLHTLVGAEADAWFVCGPEPLVDTLRDALRGQEVLTEIFHPIESAPKQQPAPGAEGLLASVTVDLDGVATTFDLPSDGDTILDAALKAKLDPPYSCAGGACGTCRAKVVLGSAVMDQNHVLDDDEIDDGFVLTCQAHPTSAELRVDYDA